MTRRPAELDDPDRRGVIYDMQPGVATKAREHGGLLTSSGRPPRWVEAVAFVAAMVFVGAFFAALTLLVLGLS